jgi:hypothetical protein
VLRLDESIEVEARASLPALSAHRPCNPSLVVQDGTLLCVYKGINFDLETEGYRFSYGGYSVPFCDSQNYFAELDMDLKVRGAHFLEDRHIRARPFALHGLQDLRLFAWRDGLWCLGAAATHEFQPGASRRHLVERVVLCRLAGNTLKVAAVLPSRQPREKNWMPWVKGDDLYAIYAQDPYEVLLLAKGRSQQSLHPATHKALQAQFGGTCVIPWQNGFIGIIHRQYRDPASAGPASGRLRTYTHSMVVYRANFDVAAVSEPFSFEGQKVEFCCGVAISGRSIFLSYGVWDREAVVLKASLDSVIRALNLQDVLATGR